MIFLSPSNDVAFPVLLASPIALTDKINYSLESGIIYAVILLCCFPSSVVIKNCQITWVAGRAIRSRQLFVFGTLKQCTTVLLLSTVHFKNLSMPILYR